MNFFDGLATFSTFEKPFENVFKHFKSVFESCWTIFRAKSKGAYSEGYLVEFGHFLNFWKTSQISM
jgi:hypothetical protein